MSNWVLDATKEWNTDFQLLHQLDKLLGRNHSKCTSSCQCLSLFWAYYPAKSYALLTVFRGFSWTIHTSLTFNSNSLCRTDGFAQFASWEIEVSIIYVSFALWYAPMHRSSPLGYLRNACSPRKRGDNGPFSNGYIIVYGGRKKFSSTIHIPKEYIWDVCRRLRQKCTSDNFSEKKQMYGFIQGTRSILVWVYLIAVRIIFDTRVRLRMSRPLIQTTR